MISKKDSKTIAARMDSHIDHHVAVQRIAEKLDLSPEKVDFIIRRFFFRGIHYHVKMGFNINIKGFGVYKRTRERSVLLKRQIKDQGESKKKWFALNQLKKKEKRF